MEAGEAAEDEQRRHLTWLVFMRLWTTAGTKPRNGGRELR